MNLRWITLFATIAEEKSFTRAATKLNIAQPWLSAQLRKLEHELGVQLLIRENVGVKVTDAGKRLLPYAMQLAEAARLFRETARSLSDTRAKVVKLGSHIPIIDLPYLKAVTLSFTNRYTNFELNTVTEDPEDLLKALEESRIDLAVLPSDMLLTNLETEVCSIGTLQVYILVPKKYKFDNVRSLKGKNIGLPLRELGTGMHEKLSEFCEEMGLLPDQVPEYDRRAIEHGVVVRDEMVVVALDEKDVASLDPKIVAMKLDGIKVEQQICRIAGRELGRAAERFWALSVQYAKALNS